MSDVEKYAPEFDYSVWTANTTLQMCSVPWDASYRDLVRFDTAAGKENWFNNQLAKGTSTGILTGVHYLKYGEPVMVPLPFSQCNKCNYLVVKNPLQPIPTRSATPTRTPDTFYYFVQDCQYVAPNTTALNVQLDVWQTYYERVSFGLSYITRGHIGVANENATLYNLSSYMQDPEGLEYGDEYDVVHSQWFNFIEGQTAAPLVLVVSNTRLDVSFGTVSKPNLQSADGSIIFGIPSGCCAYLFDTRDTEKFFSQLADAPWVSQGIVSMTVVPPFLVYPLEEGGKQVQLGGKSSGVTMYLPNTKASNTRNYYLSSLFDWFRSGVSEPYYNLLKLWQYPYCFLEVTTYEGNPMVLKPQNCNVYDELEVGSQTLKQAMRFDVRSALCPPAMKTMIYPYRYNSNGDENNDSPSWTPAGDKDTAPIKAGEYLDMAVQINDYPQLPVVNNGYMSYMASSANTRAYMFDNASWAQQKSLQAANNAYNVAQAGMKNQQANFDVNRALQYQNLNIGLEQTAWNGIKGVGSGVGSAVGSLAQGNIGGAAGNLIGAATSAVDAALDANWSIRNNANSINAQENTLANNLGYQAYQADTNYNYANFAANGDYQMAIQGINATVRDARLTQPSVSGQLNSGGYNWSNSIIGFHVKWKRIKPQYIRQIGQYFMRYGYYVNRFLTPPQNLKCMSKFTYWQMQECVVFGQIPEVFKQAIRGIFESGCTVWCNPDNIGRTAFTSNEPISGVKY